MDPTEISRVLATGIAAIDEALGSDLFRSDSGREAHTGQEVEGRAMPKEVIRGRGHDPYGLRVRWERSTYLQIGIESEDGRSLIGRLYGRDEGTLAAIGVAVDKAVHFHAKTDSMSDLGNAVLSAVVNSAPGDDTGAGFIGVWADLGREEANRMIRALRRARDDVFGKDA